MSDLTSTSYDWNKKSDNGMNPMFLILLLSLCGGGDNDLFGGFCKGNNDCGCNNGLDSMLPLLMILLMGGGSCGSC